MVELTRSIKRLNIVSMCNEYTEDGASTSLEDIERLIIRLKNHNEKPAENRDEQNERLYKALCVALAFYHYGSSSKANKKLSHEHINIQGVSVTKACKNPYLLYAKFCIPDKKGSDYDRYVNAIRIADEQNLRPTKFYRLLKKTNGGMTQFIEDNT